MLTAAAVGGTAEVCLHGTDHRFACAPGQTILAAALAAGLDMPYECASGSCGSCRARLLEGEVAPLWAGATGLSERDRAKGDRILCCQTRPLTACSVQIRLGSQLPGPAPRRVVAHVRSLQPLNEAVLRLDLCTNEPMRFLPGQFVLFEWPDGIGRRAYSMANVPGDDRTLTFLIKRKSGGAASERLFNAVRKGDVLEIEGPYGRAWLRPPARDDEPLLLLAGGSGLAPMWSIAQAALRTQPQRPVRLYFGVQRARDLFWLDEMRHLAATNERFTPVLAVAEDDAASCRHGSVADALEADLPQRAEHGLYMAGPPGLLDHVNERLVRSGRLPADRVFYDRFV